MEDYIKIIADKDEEIAALRSELEALKKQLESGSLEELVISDDSVTDNSDITLKVPDEEQEGAAPDMNMSNLMNLMSMLMGNQGPENEDEDGENEVTNEVEEDGENEVTNEVEEPESSD